MKTSEDEFGHGGGGTPPCAGLTSCALPEVRSQISSENSHTGMSTSNVFFGNEPKIKHSYWYTLRCTYGWEKKAYEYFVSKGIKAFYPTVKTQKHCNGKTTLIEESRLPNIFFAYGTFDELKKYVYDNVHEDTKHVRFYYNQHHEGSKEPLIVPDRQIKSFMLICDSNVEDVLLEPFVVKKFLKGQRVIVKEGPFAGVEGVVARFQGQQRVGISIEGLLTIVTAYVPTAFIEHIHSSKYNNR